MPRPAAQQCEASGQTLARSGRWPRGARSRARTHGSQLRRLLALAQIAFEGAHREDELQTWLIVFYERFFNNQWKRDCTVDGPKVGTVALSPRGDWRMLSDGVVTAWINEIRRPVT
ncbi:MAG: hypothetical protein ACR2PL_15535 [Dehalococcoidia bacterium]